MDRTAAAAAHTSGSPPSPKFTTHLNPAMPSLLDSALDDLPREQSDRRSAPGPRRSQGAQPDRSTPYAVSTSTLQYLTVGLFSPLADSCFRW